LTAKSVNSSADSSIAEPIVTLSGVTKRFPGVVANDDIDMAIRPGEVHVLLGENGAGKSTLIGLLSGLIAPDEGAIAIDGRATQITSPRHALSLGIGTVFQHTMLVPTLTVAENLLLGEPWWRRPRKESLQRRIGDLSASLGIEIDLDALAADLSLGEQQHVEILRALSRNSRVLILDESTSMLTPEGIEELGDLMRQLVKRGLAVVFITHKLKEAAAFGDRISVLKLGRKVGEISPDRFRSLDHDQLIAEFVEMMFGKRSGDPEDVARSPHPELRDRQPLLSASGLTLAPARGNPGLHDIAFDVRPGEILGIAGIDGNGQTQLARVLAGQQRADSGDIRFDGQSVSDWPVRARRDAGLRYLTDDRLGEGTVGSFPVSINLLLKQIGDPPFWRNGIEQTAAIDAHARDLIRQYDVRTPSEHTPIGRLSGGNIQKALLARELAEGAKAVIFNKPTYGLDLANTLATRSRIGDVAQSGKAVLLISTDLDELLALSDRIAVLAAGRIVGTVDNEPGARNAVGRLMGGLAA